MPLSRVFYRFRVTLPASRERAFRWATDYRPDDPKRMGEKGTRRVERLAKNTFLLTDVFPTAHGRVTKAKLVHLLPDRFSWTSTHVSGPAKHSQFLYELRPAGRNRCQLLFTGLQVDRSPRPPSAASLAQRARQLAREDAATWRRIAAALGRDLA